MIIYSGTLSRDTPEMETLLLDPFCSRDSLLAQ